MVDPTDVVWNNIGGWVVFCNCHIALRPAHTCCLTLSAAAMQVGFSMLESGSVSNRSVLDTMVKVCCPASPSVDGVRCLQNLLDLAVAAICFWAVGRSFAYGTSTHSLDSLIGTGDFFVDGNKSVHVSWLFQVGNPGHRSP